MPRASLYVPLAISVTVHAAVGTLAVRTVRLPASSPPPNATDVGGGDSFDVPEEMPLAQVDEPSGTPVPPGEALGPTRPVGRVTRGRGGRGASTPSEAAPLTAFGAVSERGSVDLATAFTRAFPQAASTDPVWTRVAIGPAGEADLVLDIDEAGALVASQIAGSPSAAFRAGIARTLALIGAREFTSGGPRTRLHLVATVSPDDIHDGLHGDVFAIGGSFVASEGSAFFALAIGRRIDLRVHVTP
jgi:hypothetical protein